MQNTKTLYTQNADDLTVPHNAQGDGAFRQALSLAIRRSKRKREEIAKDLSMQVGVRISRRMLDEFSAQSRAPYRFPAVWIEPLCRVLGDDSLLVELLPRKLRRRLELGERAEELLIESHATGSHSSPLASPIKKGRR